MILDKLLLENLSSIGEIMLSKSNLNSMPKNIDEMYIFLNTIKNSIDSNEFEGILLGNIFYSFVSSKEVRDRNVTSRIFEDIFSGLFHEHSTDTSQRVNPEPTKELLDLDHFCSNEDWLISSDLSTNKREKTDLSIGNYSISLKTLKGQAYDINDKLTNPSDKKFNNELNVGSLSYRALLKGILSDEQLQNLKDRKGGLGSKNQLLKYVLSPIKKSNLDSQFRARLSLFLNYIYDDDVYIVLKSDYRIIFHLIPKNSFINSLLLTLDEDYSKFSDIFYRWENNNLRLNWVKMLTAMDDLKLPYYTVIIKLQNSVSNTDFISFKNKISELINEEIGKYMIVQ